MAKKKKTIAEALSEEVAKGTIKLQQDINQSMFDRLSTMTWPVVSTPKKNVENVLTPGVIDDSGMKFAGLKGALSLEGSPLTKEYLDETRNMILGHSGIPQSNFTQEPETKPSPLREWLKAGKT